MSTPAPRPYGDTPGVCDWCGKTLPDDKRFRWCGQACIDQWLALTDWATMCKLVYARDGGICQICGWDVAGALRRVSNMKLKQHTRADRSEACPTWRVVEESVVSSLALRQHKNDRDRSIDWDDWGDLWAHGYWWRRTFPPLREVDIAKVVRRMVNRLGLNQANRWYEFDHIIPRVEGGPDSVENLRVLCVPCHKVETKALAGRRAGRRRAQKATRQSHLDLAV